MAAPTDQQVLGIIEVCRQPPYLDLLGELLKPRSIAYFASDPKRNWDSHIGDNVGEVIPVLAWSGLLNEVMAGGIVKYKVSPAGAMLLSQYAADLEVRRRSRDTL